MRPVSRWPDRPFAPWSIFGACGPVQSPPLSAMRAAVAEVIAADPASPAAVVVHDGAAWRRDPAPDPDALAARLVLPAAAIDVDAPGALAAVCSGAPPIADGLPFRIEVGPTHMTFAMRHLVGDAGLANALLTGLTRAAFGGGVPPMLTTPTTPGVTRRVLAELVRRAPRQRRVGAVDAPPATGEPWVVTPAVTHAAFDVSVHRGLVAGSRRLGVRRSSLVVSLFEQAVAAHGLAPTHDLRTMVVDCRRYLDQPMSVRGNFAAGMPLRAPWSDPVAVEAAVAAALDAGRPLAFLVHGAVMSRVLPARVTLPLVDPDAPRRLLPDYSIVGPLNEATRMPWTGPAQYLGGSHARRPDACGVIYLEVGRAPQLAVAHDAGYVPQARMAEVLQTFGELARTLIATA